MSATIDLRQPSTRPIRHDGECGLRERCWRESCRAEFGPYRTVEVLWSGLRLAYCHGTSATPLQVRAEIAAAERRRAA